MGDWPTPPGQSREDSWKWTLKGWIMGNPNGKTPSPGGSANKLADQPNQGFEALRAKVDEMTGRIERLEAFAVEAKKKAPK
jgi:hypothetical protein